MHKRHFSKLILMIMLAFSVNVIVAQEDFTSSFNKAQRLSRTDIRTAVSDNQNNNSHIPVSIIKGKAEGPVFTIVAGVHGYEYPPIIATQELLNEIDEGQLTGTLVIIPIANIPSFYGRSPFVNPQDHLNLNRTFPGKPDGSVTEQIADFITNTIIPVSDIFLDIHGGDASEDLLPFVCYYNNEQKPEKTGLARQLAETSGFQYIVSYPYTLKDDQPAKYAFKQAVQLGKTALSIESGKLGNVQEEAVALTKRGIYNMLAELEMYPQSTEENIAITQLKNQVYMRAESQGIFFSDLRSGDTVKEGEVVGHVQDEFGKVSIELKAPHSGIILYKIGTPPVNVGETIMCIAY